MKRGFTLLEMLISTALSAMAFAAIGVAFAGVWRLTKESSDELQATLMGRAMRERLLYGADDWPGLMTGTTNMVVTISSKGAFSVADQGSSFKSSELHRAISFDSRGACGIAADEQVDPDRLHSFRACLNASLYPKAKRAEDRVEYVDPVLVTILGVVK